jgi:hypothetical protein
MDIEKVKDGLKKMVPEFSAKVAPLYQQLSWTWGDGNKEHIPTRRDIEQCLYRLINELEDPGILTLETGGLGVKVTKPTKNDSGEYDLYFILSQEGYFND